MLGHRGYGLQVGSAQLDADDVDGVGQWLCFHQKTPVGLITGQSKNTERTFLAELPCVAAHRLCRQRLPRMGHASLLD